MISDTGGVGQAENRGVISGGGSLAVFAFGADVAFVIMEADFQVPGFRPMPDQKLACPKCRARFILPVEMLIAPEGRIALVTCPGCAKKSPVSAFVDEVQRMKQEKIEAKRAAEHAIQIQEAEDRRNAQIEKRRQEREKEQQERAAALVAMQAELRQKETARAIANAIDTAHVVPAQSAPRSGNKTKLILAAMNAVTVVCLGALYLHFTREESKPKTRIHDPVIEQCREAIRKAATSRGKKPKLDAIQRATDFAEVVIERGRVGSDIACISIGVSIEDVPAIPDERELLFWETKINDYQNYLAIIANPDERKLRWITEQPDFRKLLVSCPGRSFDHLSGYVYQYLASKGNLSVDRDRLGLAVCDDFPGDKGCNVCAAACRRFADNLNEASFVE